MHCLQPFHRPLPPSVAPLLVVLTLAPAGCGGSDTSEPSPDRSATSAAESPVTTFREDVAFLREHSGVQTLQAAHGGRVALSAAYQGRVMTSAVGPDRRSLGWVNRSFIRRDTVGTAFDNYGGEDRFWLGPEGGQYGLYFPPVDSVRTADEEGSLGSDFFSLSAWQVPTDLQRGRWTLENRTDERVTFSRELRVTNVQGTSFRVRVDRTVELLDGDAVERFWGVRPTDDLEWVGYQTINRVTNVGHDPWRPETGLLSVWILGQFEPFGTSWVVLPYRSENEGPVVSDAYFGPVPSDRMEVREGYVLFEADGDHRSKIGIGPAHARSVLGSYNRAEQLLTLVHFNRPDSASRYVNSLWRNQDRPYDGKVVHSYNDGPAEPGGASLGGFYELETSSPALALRPGEAYTHVHRTLHLTGSTGVLDRLVEETLGVHGSTIAVGIPGGEDSGD